MKKELIAVKNRIKKLKDKKALIDEELEPLFIREEELENEEIIAICRKNNITISDLMAKVNRQKAAMKKWRKQMKTSLKKNNKFWTVALAVIVSISCIFRSLDGCLCTGAKI